MPGFKKGPILLGLAAILGVPAAAGDFHPVMIPFIPLYLLVRLVAGICQLSAKAFCYVVSSGSDLDDKAVTSPGSTPSSSLGSSRGDVVGTPVATGTEGGGAQVPMPVLKRHTNFLMIRNLTDTAWTFQVADRKENEKGMKENGDLYLYVVTDPNPPGCFAQLKMGPGTAPVVLKKDVNYIVYPKVETVLGSKLFSDDFVRTIYLTDAQGVRLAFNLVRQAKSGAKVTFGYTQNSWPTNPDHAVVWLDKDEDDIIQIRATGVIDPPKKPN